MTYENRQPANFAFGTLTAAAAISDTTLTSADFASRLAGGLSTTTYVPITLQDPSTGFYEIVWVNAHTAAATTCTVLRGREGTTARAWGNGTLWVCAPTLRDGVLPVPTRTALPTDPHVGMRAYIMDEQVSVAYVLNVGWLSQSGMAYRATLLLGADAANVTFSAIPATLKKLQIVWTARSTRAASLADDLRLRINGSSSAVYYGNGHNQQGTVITGFTENALTSGFAGTIAAASAAVTNFGSGEVNLTGWDAPAARAAMNWHYHSNMFETTVDCYYSQGGGLYSAVSPYTSVTMFATNGNLRTGSEFTIYGWG